MSKEDIAIYTSFLWPECSVVMTAVIHLLVLPLLCRYLVLTVEAGKNLQCCYPQKNPLSSKNIIISTLGESLQVKRDLLLVTKAVGVLPCLWGMLWKFNFFFFFPEAHGFKWDQYSRKLKLLRSQFCSRFVWDNFRDVGLIWLQKPLAAVGEYFLSVNSKERLSSLPGSGRVGVYQLGKSWWERS